MKSQKILNDPVYGFITIPSELIFAIIDHPYFQRLRRIRQLGLTDFVYPGALHTRFHHAIGAMHLMSITLDNLRIKGTDISEEEYEAALIAILLHDIGHGPFSHALEYSLLRGIPHEELSLLTIELLNEEFGGQLTLALRIFKNQYPKKFLHQLVSSQLDIDRLDYLQRDCFFTGVSEGTIGADRIIKMMAVKDDQLVIEEKGIYSIENFLMARRLMYWQVYLHKTAIAAETMLIQILRRAKDLMAQGTKTIKFLDRTFNANKNTFDLFDYIISINNNRTVFQFEITGDTLDRSIIEHLNNKAPKGLIRFEIGIQSTNKETNLLVDRYQNNQVLFDNIRLIQEGNVIDLHLDLIAGLPKENIESFIKTFNDVFSLGALELQLGFLKMLKGTKIRREANKYGYIYNELAPYEIIENDCLSKSDIDEISYLINEDFTMATQQPVDQGKIFEDRAGTTPGSSYDDILDFSERNPFGEVDEY